MPHIESTMVSPSPATRRNVPVLTQVVETDAGTKAAEGIVNSEAQQEVVLRVMQRLDVALEKQLPVAVAALVQAHMQALGPQLWDEVARVVKKSVEQAVAQELGQRRKP